MTLRSLPLLSLFASTTAWAQPALGGLKATLNGEPLPLVGAALYSQGGSARTLELSTEPLPCSVYAELGRSIAPGERYFSVSFKPLLQADGTLKWTTESLEMTQQRPEGELTKITLLDTDAGKPARFRFDDLFVLPANKFFERPEAKLELRGEGTADGCGVRKGLSEATARPQTGLKLTVAGRAFPMLGATLSADGSELELNSSPLDCSGSAGHDLRIKIQLKPNDDQTYSIYASGDLFQMQYNMTAAVAPAAGGPGLFIQVAPEATKGSPRAVRIEGTFTLDEFPAVISGEASAVDCSGT